jgi:hypothetical protein
MNFLSFLPSYCRGILVGKGTFWVIQAIPTFVMRCFQLSVSTCDDMRKYIANQWWGMEDENKKLNWRSWEWLSSPKENERTWILIF